MLEERVDHTIYIFSAYFNFSLSMPILSDGGITAYFAQTAMSMSGVVTLSVVASLIHFLWATRDWNH